MSDMNVMQIVCGLDCCLQHGTLGENNCNGTWMQLGHSNSVFCIDNYRFACNYGDYGKDCLQTLGRDATNCIIKQMKEIEALKKEKEPRVLTIEEIAEMKEYDTCAIEQKSKYTHLISNAEYHGTIKLNGMDLYSFILCSEISPFRRRSNTYGETWRCWNKRPTKEKMEATPWN